MSETKKLRILFCGASKGNALALAKELSARGHQLTLLSRSPADLRDQCDSLEGNGHDWIADDVTSSSEWIESIRERQSQSPYHAYLCMMGGAKPHPLVETTNDQLSFDLHKRLLTNATVVNELLGEMRRARFGRILLLGPSHIKNRSGGSVANVTSAAVLSWARALALEVASHGITVNCILTGLIKQANAQVALSKSDTAKLKRFGSISDLAELVSFFISDKSSFVTAQSIAMDGGQSPSL